MYTAMLTVENIVGAAQHDIWAVNVEEEYQEEKTAGRGARGPGTRGSSGTGRDAPLLPRADRASSAVAAKP